MFSNGFSIFDSTLCLLFGLTELINVPHNENKWKISMIVHSREVYLM